MGTNYKKQKIQSEYEETPFLLWGDLAQVTQKFCGVSILENIQSPTADSPKHQALAAPIWAEGLE